MSVSEMRRQRRAKLAAKQAETIVEEAVARVTASPPPSAQEGTPAQVRDMRDNKGMTWMEIGAALGLPGAKSGAGQARKLYAAANAGVVPRKYAPRKGTKPKPTTPGSVGTVTSRKEQLVTQGHVIPRDMPDEEVEALLVGRTIEWAIDLARLTGTDPKEWGAESHRWVKQDAKVHVLADNVWVGDIEGTEGRVVKFREYAGFDTDRQRHMSGPTKVVRVDSIYTIR